MSAAPGWGHGANVVAPPAGEADPGEQKDDRREVQVDGERENSIPLENYLVVLDEGRRFA